MPILVRMAMTPLVIILFFPAGGFRELTTSLVVLGHVLVVHLVFILIPLVLVTSVFIVVPLGPAARAVVVVSLRCHRASQCRAHEKYG